ncbi:MAG: RluA family pseudouridine synthase [Planctomycetota bacterium]|nr:RluA family pseudouridine synthase [Planctomycetota bacterium]
MSNPNPPASSGPPEVHFSVADYLGGRRIDAVVGRQLRNHTRFRIHRLLRAAAVCIDGRVASPTQRVYPGQRIAVRLLEPPDKLLRATPMPLEVIYEDEWLVAINKPAGLIMHPAKYDTADTLVNGLQWYLDQSAPAIGLLRPGIVHRLDKNTSGVLISTRDHLSHRQLSISFQDREVQKTYLAIVEGCPRPESGTIDSPLGGTTAPDSSLVSAEPDAIAPRSARTDFTVLEKLAGCSLVEARPLTGRLHQVRVHLASIGHPLLGEPFYGPRGEIRCDREGRPLVTPPANPPWPSIARHALHARSLSFNHPITGQPLTIEAPLPDDFQQVLTRAAR